MGYGGRYHGKCRSKKVICVSVDGERKLGIAGNGGGGGGGGKKGIYHKVGLDFRVRSGLA